MQEQPQPQRQFDLTGLSVPQDNPYKKMTRQALLTRAIKLHQQNKSLSKRLAFLQPHKQKQFHPPNPKKSLRLFETFKMKKFALKIAYIGVTYNGLTIQKSTDNTVEAYLFRSLYSLSLVRGLEPGEDYTRAGRTDTGVSAFGNVVSLYMRSSEVREGVKEGQGEEQPEQPERRQQLERRQQQQQPAKSTKPIQYCRLINNQLPSDIRILCVRQVPQPFNARYWCTQRSYKYFFTRNHLNLPAMQQAISHFIGTHNFINFCRIDVVATTNYDRNIEVASIEQVKFQQPQSDFRNQLYYFHFVGNAFLWHQIRFMATILFMVGAGKEEPDIVSELLDPVRFPRKPNYPISPEYPLILEDCRYKEVEFTIQLEDAISFYNEFNKMAMHKLLDICLYLNCQHTMNSWLLSNLNPDWRITHNQLITLSQQQTERLASKRAGKRLSLHKSSCIGVEEAIGNLKGKRLELYEKRAQKQAEYEERVRRAAETQGRQQEGEEEEGEQVGGGKEKEKEKVVLLQEE